MKNEEGARWLFFSTPPLTIAQRAKHFGLPVLPGTSLHLGRKSGFGQSGYYQRAGPVFDPGKVNTAGATGRGFAMVQTPAQLGAGEPAPQKVRARINMNSRVNTRRADLDLPQFDLPPPEPVFRKNPVAELVITNIAGKITLKLRVPSPPAQYTLVQGPAPVRTAVRCVQHYPFLGLLPPPTDGWSDITELYVARHGVPSPGKAVWIRTCQHIDGWTDVPKVARARVPAPAA